MTRPLHPFLPPYFFLVIMRCARLDAYHSPPWQPCLPPPPPFIISAPSVLPSGDLPTGWDRFAKWRGLPPLTPAMQALASKKQSQPLTALMALQKAYGGREVSGE
jgi:hypothetical protein